MSLSNRAVCHVGDVVMNDACTDGGEAYQYDGLQEGERVGRFLLLRDHDGCLHAVAAGAVAILREADDGTLLMLSGGRMLSVPRAMRTVLGWLDGRG